MEITLLDTNILIQILKGDKKTIEKVQSFSTKIAISSISSMELYYGALDKSEVKKIEKFISLFEVIHLNHAISIYATKLIKTYAKSHNLDIPDSLIAASAIINQSNLFTYNTKDFGYIDELQLI